MPCAIKFCVASTPAVSEPRTAATTTTDFARLFNGTAFEACGADYRRLVCCCLHGRLLKETKEKKLDNSHYEDVCTLSGIGLFGLTFTCLHALKPPVVTVTVAGTSAVPKPSTPRSATTDSSGPLKLAALCAYHRIS